MIITVKLFAAYQEAYHCSEIRWEFPENTPVSAVLDRAIAQHPHLERWREITRFAIDLQFVKANTLLKDGNEVVLIPPVSGGIARRNDNFIYNFIMGEGSIDEKD
jgi:molybdopterin synthase sulfur carrier subunit